jgi:hypothetical protein
MIHFGRLRALNAFLKTLQPHQVDLAIVRSQCGTICCAMGWAPGVPELKEFISWKLPTLGIREFKMSSGNVCTFRGAASELFGISVVDADYLFSSREASPYVGSFSGNDRELFEHRLKTFFRINDRLL